MSPVYFYRERAPVVTGSFLTVLTVLSLTVAHLPLLILHVFGLIVLLLGTHGSHQAWPLIRPALLLGLVVWIANPIFNHRGATILFHVLAWPITIEAFLVGARYGLALTAMVLLTFLWEAWIPEQAWQALGQATLPRTVFMVRLALGFVPALEARFTASRLAQASLAWDTGSPAKAAGENLRHVVAWTLEDGLAIAQDLNAKGFGLPQRHPLPTPSLRAFDWGLLGLGSLLAAALSASLSLLGPAHFYPVYQPWPPSMSLGVAAVAWLLFMSQPLCFHAFQTIRLRKRRGPYDSP